MKPDAGGRGCVSGQRAGQNKKVLLFHPKSDGCASLTRRTASAALQSAAAVPMCHTPWACCVYAPSALLHAALSTSHAAKPARPHTQPERIARIAAGAPRGSHAGPSDTAGTMVRLKLLRSLLAAAERLLRADASGLVQMNLHDWDDIRKVAALMEQLVEEADEAHGYTAAVAAAV